MASARVPTSASADITLFGLFTAFLTVSLLGFGGPVIWVRRILVDRRRWLDDQELTDLLSFCSFMPGPNMVSMAVCVGSKFRGRAGALAALTGFIVIPCTLGFALGSIYLHYQRIEAVQGILRGLAATAAGLIIGTGLRLLLPQRRRPLALLFAALACVGLAVAKLPLLAVVLGLVPLSIAAAWIERGRLMPAAALALVGHIALLSLISFGGIPGVLSDLHDFVVTSHGWLSDRDFANAFGVVQAIPGPNMVLMASFIGWQVGGLPAAAASAVAMFAPACVLSYSVFGYWDRFRHTPWQAVVRRGLAPVTIGLMIAGGLVMARAGDPGWPGIALTVLAAGAILATRINPLWLLGGGALLGGLGWL